jgi:hypothetical protein
MPKLNYHEATNYYQGLKINHLEKEKRIKSEEKSTQCNITKKIIDDLKDEIDLLHFEKERQEENNNEIIETRNDTCLLFSSDFILFSFSKWFILSP